MFNTSYHHKDAAAFREKAVKTIHKTKSLFGRNLRATLFTIAFIAADAIGMYFLWLKYLSSTSNTVLFSLVISLALGMNLPAAIAGANLKEASQGLATRKLAWIMLTLCFIAFLVVFVPNSLFRLESRDTLIEKSTDTGVEDIMAEESTAEADPEAAEDKSVWYAALVFVAAPLMTSIASGMLGFYLTDPLDDALFLLDDQIVRHSNMKIMLNAELEEVGSVEAYMDEARQTEEERLRAFTTQLQAERNLMHQLARVLIMEALHDPDKLSRIETNARKLLEQNGIEASALEPSERAARTNHLSTDISVA